MSFVSFGALIAVLAAAEGPERVAVLVGSNQPVAERTTLRYAHEDVQRLADVLIQAGRFSASDVHVLLDPTSAQVLSTLDDALDALKKRAGETMLFFYYSGHADDSALYVKGKPLPLEELRHRLDRTDTAVRMGVLDACRGGAWTRAKGLSPAQPFEVEIPLKLSSEGSVLIASSSGLENAHESESLRGSFFTHHLVAGLRGAADSSGDGIVTLNEAYAYAKERTIRDTALAVGAPQHPSFNMNLRGRSDLPLTAITNSPTILAVEERHGPLELIHLSTGLKVLELSEGEREVLLAVAPGRYILRRIDDDKVYSREFNVSANQSLTLDEGSLTLAGSDRLAAKGPQELHRSDRTTLPAGTAEITLAMGSSHYSPSLTGVGASGGNFVLEGSLSWGLTDRLQWPILRPAMAYRFGERGGQEWVLTGGVLGWTFNDAGGFLYAPGVHLDFRQWLNERNAVNAGIRFGSVASIGGSASRPPNDWETGFLLGYSYFVSERVTVNFSVSWWQLAFRQSSFVLFNPDPARIGTLSIGSVGTIGLRPLPLVQLHVGRVFSLFGNAALQWSVPDGSLSELYELGFAFVF